MNSKVRASTLSWRWDGQNTATKKTGMGSGNGGCARDTRECRLLSGNENSEERELTTAQILKQAGRRQIRNAAATRSGLEFPILHVAARAHSRVRGLPSISNVHYIARNSLGRSRNSWKWFTNKHASMHIRSSAWYWLAHVRIHPSMHICWRRWGLSQCGRLCRSRRPEEDGNAGRRPENAYLMISIGTRAHIFVLVSSKDCSSVLTRCHLLPSQLTRQTFQTLPRPCLVLVISNLVAHAWNIKYRRKQTNYTV